MARVVQKRSHTKSHTQFAILARSLTRNSLTLAHTRTHTHPHSYTCTIATAAAYAGNMAVACACVCVRVCARLCASFPCVLGNCQKHLGYTTSECKSFCTHFECFCRVKCLCANVHSMLIHIVGMLCCTYHTPLALPYTHACRNTHTAIVTHVLCCLSGQKCFRSLTLEW